MGLGMKEMNFKALSGLVLAMLFLLNGPSTASSSKARGDKLKSL